MAYRVAAQFRLSNFERKKANSFETQKNFEMKTRFIGSCEDRLVRLNVKQDAI